MSIELLKAIDEICERYEDQQQSNEPTQIEEYLPTSWSKEQRTQLIYHLLKIELEYQIRRGQEPNADVLKARFSDTPEVVDTVLRSLLEKHEAGPSALLDEVGRKVAHSQHGPTIGLAPPVMPRPQGVNHLSTAQNPTGPFLADPDASTPVVFGRRIAQGGMGAILEGSDRKLGRTIAVKVMLPESGSNEDQMRRFVQEAAVLGKLEHPNIVPVHDLGRDSSGQLYYTMKLVNGRTLQDILHDLRNEKPDALEQYNLDRLLTIFRKVCDGLAFAHSNKIIHRDLKPANLMVGEFGEVLVMDWGLAKILDGRSEIDGVDAFTAPDKETGSGVGSATMDGTVMGTPNYMSPEQAMGKVNEMDARSDIFSLGGILYAILTLRPPVEGNTLMEVLEKVKSANITTPSTFGDSTGKGKPGAKGEVFEAKKIKPLPHVPAGRVPAALSAVAMKALRLEKTQRYQDVAAFSADIEAYQAGFATTAEEAGLGKQLVLLIKRHKGIFTTAAAAWLIVTALAVWFLFNLRSKEKRASSAEAVAVQERETAREERETARQALAKSQLDLAEKEFGLGKFVEAEKILGDTPESFRDANWSFLRAQSRDYTAQLPISGKGDVKLLKFLPQGDRFAVRCWLDAIGVFTVTGRQIGDWIPVSGDYFGAFGMDSTGGRLAFPVSAGEIAVQEVSTGKLVGRWPCQLEEKKNVLLSPDGGTVLVTGGKQQIAYDAQTGASLWKQPYFDVLPAFSPDGRAVAVLSAKNELDLKIEILDTGTGAVLSTLEATADNPEKTALQFNEAGDQLACLGGDEIILWNPKTSAKIRGLHFPGETVKLLSPDGEAVATSSGSRIRLWDTQTGRLLRSFNGAGTKVVNLAIGNNGKTLLSSHVGGIGGLVNVWPIRLDEEIASAWVETRMETTDCIRVLFGRDGSGFYAVAGHTFLALESRGGRQRWRCFSEGDRFRDLAEHPTDGSIIFSDRAEQKLYRLSSAGEVSEAFPSPMFASLKFNRSGQLLLSVRNAFLAVNPGSGFRVVEYPSGKELRKILFESNARQPFATFCLDDAAVAVAGLAGGITVWDWKAGAQLRQIAAAKTGSIACLDVSPDGLHLATGGPDRWIRVWEVATGRLEAAFRAHWEGVRCVKFSPDGREILSGSEDGTVRIHDPTNGEQRLAFYGLTAPVADVDISADGTLIAAITTEGFTQVWDRQRSSSAVPPPKKPELVQPKKPDLVLPKKPETVLQKKPEPVLPKKPKPLLPKDAEGWEDLLAPLTEAKVAETGRGWTLKDGELLSPDTKWATLPLPCKVFGTNYHLRVTLRRLAVKNVFHIVLPVADRMGGFELDGRPHNGFYTGLYLVNGKFGKDVPGILEGQQVKDTSNHWLDLTVRLDGVNATITTTLDDEPLYEWSGPTAALSQQASWATTEPGALAFGTFNGGWAVSEVMLKRLPPVTTAPSAP